MDSALAGCAVGELGAGVARCARLEVGSLLVSARIVRGCSLHFLLQGEAMLRADDSGEVGGVACEVAVVRGETGVVALVAGRIGAPAVTREAASVVQLAAAGDVGTRVGARAMLYGEMGEAVRGEASFAVAREEVPAEASEIVGMGTVAHAGVHEEEHARARARALEVTRAVEGAVAGEVVLGRARGDERAGARGDERA